MQDGSLSNGESALFQPPLDTYGERLNSDSNSSAAGLWYKENAVFSQAPVQVRMKIVGMLCFQVFWIKASNDIWS